ncbi:hypothetical protein J7L68_03600 [bacterium]|nr:hypothetical protein [bacterium]
MRIYYHESEKANKKFKISSFYLRIEFVGFQNTLVVLGGDSGLFINIYGLIQIG